MGFGAIFETLRNELDQWFVEEACVPLESHDKVDFGLSGNVKVSGLPGLSLKSDFLPLLRSVLLHVLVGTLEDDLALGFGIL